MTITVIGHRDDIDHEATCYGCGSILSYRRPDMKHGYQHGSEGRHIMYIECPVCKDKHADNPNIDNIGRVEVNPS